MEKEKFWERSNPLTIPITRKDEADFAVLWVYDLFFFFLFFCFLSFLPSSWKLYLILNWQITCTWASGDKAQFLFEEWMRDTLLSSPFLFCKFPIQRPTTPSTYTYVLIRHGANAWMKLTPCPLVN